MWRGMMTGDRLIRADAAAGMLGVSQATFWRRVGDGTIPPAIKIGTASRWRESEIAAAIDRLASASRDPVLKTANVAKPGQTTFPIGGNVAVLHVRKRTRRSA